MTTFPEIFLEDQPDGGWTQAKARLATAAETFGYPFFIATEETAVAYKDLASFMSHREDPDPVLAVLAEEWFKDFAKQVYNWDEAIRVLYPWFHEGEELV